MFGTSVCFARAAARAARKSGAALAFPALRD
jgi:hypothetical protein